MIKFGFDEAVTCPMIECVPVSNKQAIATAKMGVGFFILRLYPVNSFVIRCNMPPAFNRSHPLAGRILWPVGIDKRSVKATHYARLDSLLGPNPHAVAAAWRNRDRDNVSFFRGDLFHLI